MKTARTQIAAIAVMLVAIVALAACGATDLDESIELALDIAEGTPATSVATSEEPQEHHALYPTIMPATPSQHIHQLKLGPANAFLIEGPEGLILVDTSLAIYAKRILKEIETIDRGPLCLIYLTHGHIDHYAGANALREATGAPIAAHSADVEAIEAGETRLGSVRNWQWTLPWMPYVEHLVRVEPTPVDIVLEDGDAVTACGIDGTSIWTPGHTPGSSSLLLRVKDPEGAMESTHIFVGDLIAHSGNPRIQRTYAQNWSLLQPSVHRTTALQPDFYYPGHGDAPITLQQVQDMKISGPAAQD
jgi:glyoxylase-like metal-dependent hydrolase (beta-lactamase superfamily II)